MVLKELEKIIHDIQMKITLSKKYDATVYSLSQAKEHLTKALEILNEGGDY